MKWMLTMLVAACVARGAGAAPTMSGTADEIAAQLKAMPGRITLRGECERKVEADCANVVVLISNSEKSLRPALQKNQATRAEILAALERDGIPTGRVHMTRFSSAPRTGFFSGKAKAFDIESRMLVEATSEKDILAVASFMEGRTDVALVSISFENTQQEAIGKEVLSRALSRVDELKSVYEKQLGARLVVRAVGPQDHGRPVEPALRRHTVGKEVSGMAQALSSPELGAVIHALEQAPPDLSQFDQVVYRATVDVTFDVFPEDRK